MEDKDYMIRAISGNEEVRAFAVTSGHLVEEARKIHDDSPIATAALGRTLSAALMMGDMLTKSSPQQISMARSRDMLQIRVSFCHQTPPVTSMSEEP